MSALLAPLKYLKITNSAKRVYDLALPVAGATGLTCLLLVWPGEADIFGENGFLAGLQDFVAIIGGFFVAALTLVNTTSSASLDAPVSGTPRLVMTGQAEPITRKQLLCFLFGYLAFSAFCLYAIGLLAMLVAPGIKEVLAAGWEFPAKLAFVGAYTLWLSHVFVATLFGLYYFTDRLQRPDTTVRAAAHRPVPAE